MEHTKIWNQRGMAAKRGRLASSIFLYCLLACAMMNKRGELIGLNFDLSHESITKVWCFDTAIKRAIDLDIRYMLWVVKEVEHADKLLVEMTSIYPKPAEAGNR